MIIRGFENYAISEAGVITNIKTGRILKTYVSNGYYRVMLSNKRFKKRIFVHRLVAEAYIPNLETKPQVNHIDGNKLNNNVANLEWVSRSENQRHAIIHGLQISSYGSQHYATDLTEDKVKQIREEYASTNISQLKLGQKYDLHQGTVGELVRGDTWKHAPGPLTAKGRKGAVK